MTDAPFEKATDSSGNARAVFEYFVGYKLGLTATPKDYLKKFDASKPTTRDPRESERRLHFYFGCGMERNRTLREALAAAPRVLPIAGFIGRE